LPGFLLTPHLQDIGQQRSPALRTDISAELIPNVLWRQAQIGQLLQRGFSR
jgi:hypothetical protein